MRLNEVTYTDAKPVEGYGEGFFRIGGEVIYGPVITGPDGTAAWGGFDDAEALLRLAERIDVLFIGTGRDVAYLPPDLKQRLDDANIGAEIMASPAACRTYNVLLSEGRRIALALIPV